MQKFETPKPMGFDENFARCIYILKDHLPSVKMEENSKNYGKNNGKQINVPDKRGVSGQKPKKACFLSADVTK